MKGVASEELTNGLVVAAEANDVEAVVKEVEAGAKINMLDSDPLSSMAWPGGACALHWAVLNRNVDMLRYLLGKGADVDCLTGSGRTALHLATQVLDPQMCHLLLEAGANPNALGPMNETPLHLVTWELGEMRADDQPVSGALDRDNAEKIAALLFAFGARCDIKTQAGYSVIDYPRHAIVELVQSIRKTVVECLEIPLNARTSNGVSI